MNYSKKLIVVAAATGVIGAAGVGASAIAATNSNSSDYPAIVQKIANTFGLDPAKVNDVFKQQHQDNIQERQAKLKAVLDQAVKDGKLTSDQENKLITELQTLRSQNKADHRQDRHNLRNQLEQWAQDNGISNLDQILPAPGMGMHHHLMDNDGDADDSGSSTPNLNQG